MLRLAAQEAEHLAQAHLGGVVAAQLRELALHTIEHLVGGSQERGKAPTVLLRFTEDGATIHLHLGEHLLQPPLLRGTHVGKPLMHRLSLL